MLFGTAAAIGADMLVEIFVAIIVDEFFSCFNTFDGIDKNAPTHDLWFAIRLARVINITSDIRAHRAINRLARVHFKEILAPARVLLGSSERAPDVFNNALTFFVGTHSKKTEPGARPPHPNAVGV